MGILGPFENPDDAAIRSLLERTQRIWFQIGCIDYDDARRAQARGVTVVMDRCLMVDHARLLGRTWRRT